MTRRVEPHLVIARCLSSAYRRNWQRVFAAPQFVDIAPAHRAKGFRFARLADPPPMPAASRDDRPMLGV